MIILGAVIILLLLVLIFRKSSNSKDYDEAFKKLDVGDIVGLT